MPVCVYNNTEGDDDARVLAAFKEPSWNNPVVRILDHKKKDIVERLAKPWTVDALCQTMVAALKKQKRKVPAYLNLLAMEERSRASGVETAVFGMT